MLSLLERGSGLPRPLRSEIAIRFRYLVLSGHGLHFLDDKSFRTVCFGNDKEKGARIRAEASSGSKALKIGINQAFGS